MKKNNKTIVLLMLGILLNICLRVPIVNSESTSSDSFHNSYYVESIITKKFLDTNTNVESIFGISNDSYPPGIFFFIAIIKQLSKLDLKTTILVYSILISIISFLFTYRLGLLIFNNSKNWSFILAIMYSTTPIFLRLTYWNASARTLSIALIPILVFYSMKELNTDSGFKNKLLILIILSLLFIIHRMTIISLFVYIIPIILIKAFYKKYLKLYSKYIHFKRYLILILLFIIILFFLIQFSPTEFFLKNKADYRNSLFFEANSNYGFKNNITIAINLFLNYFSRFGIIIILVGFYLINLLNTHQKKDFSKKELYIITAFILLVPVTSKGIYVSLVGAIVFCILAVISLKNCNFSNKAVIIIILLIFSIIFSQLNVYRQLYTPFQSFNSSLVDKKTDSAINYIQDNTKNNLLISNNLLNWITSTKLKKKYLPSRSNNLMDYKSGDSLQKYETFSQKFPEINIEADINLWQRTIYNLNNPITHFTLTLFNINYLFDIKDDSSVLRESWEIYSELPTSKNKIYDNGIEEIYYLNLENEN